MNSVNPPYTLSQLMREHNQLKLPANTEWLDARDLDSEQAFFVIEEAIARPLSIPT
jgi:ribosomal protein S12 methylthiotransferase accessory factor YcaO